MLEETEEKQQISVFECINLWVNWQKKKNLYYGNYPFSYIPSTISKPNEMVACQEIRQVQDKYVAFSFKYATGCVQKSLKFPVWLFQTKS